MGRITNRGKKKGNGYGAVELLEIGGLQSDITELIIQYGGQVFTILQRLSKTKNPGRITQDTDKRGVCSHIKWVSKR